MECCAAPSHFVHVLIVLFFVLEFLCAKRAPFTITIAHVSDFDQDRSSKFSFTNLSVNCKQFLTTRRSRIRENTCTPLKYTHTHARGNYQSTVDKQVLKM